MSSSSSPHPSALPFILGERSTLDALPDECGGLPFTKIPINGVSDSISVRSGVTEALTDRPLDALSSELSVDPGRFTRLLNLANGVCYGGGMGMPEWVMLDCALLPACFIGWMTPAHTLSAQTRVTLNRGLAQVEEARSPSRALVESALNVSLGPLREGEWVPTSEFCSIPRLISSEVVGYSLYSLLRGLGVRAKALGLWVMATRGVLKQVGVAQWSNLPALRAHLRFGALELIDPITPLHTKAGETMIYRLTLPPQDRLKSIALGEQAPRPDLLAEHTTQRGVALDQLQTLWVNAESLSEWLGWRQRGAQVWLLDARRSPESEAGVELLIDVKEVRSKYAD